VNLHLSSIARRALGTALATTLVAGSLASAASPAGDTLDADFNFRDETRTAVLAIYPFSDVESSLSSFRVRGPKVSWIYSHGQSQGFVGWQVIIRTAPTKDGPWTLDRKTPIKAILANDSGNLEQFADRTVNFRDRTGTFYVRMTTRLTWFLEDGNGPISWAKHIYTRYGLVWSSGIAPEFGDQTKTRVVAPNIWPG